MNNHVIVFLKNEENKMKLESWWQSDSLPHEGMSLYSLTSTLHVHSAPDGWRVKLFPPLPDMIGVTGAQAVYEGRVNKWNKRKKLLTCTCILYEYMYCTLF